jgi:hypothetical protein
MPFKWTTQEDDVLKKMAQTKMSYEDMAMVLKSRTPKAIEIHCHDLGIQILKHAREIDFEAFKTLIKTVRNPKCV